VSGDRRSEELRGCGGVTPLGDEHVDDLLVLVDRPVHVAPDPGDFHVGLVDEPPAAYGVAGRPSGLDQHRRESLYPPVQRDVVDLDPSLGEELPRGRDRTGRSADTSAPPTRSPQAGTGSRRKPPSPGGSACGTVGASSHELRPSRHGQAQRNGADSAICKRRFSVYQPVTEWPGRRCWPFS
jgi:hypothetical protein